MYKFKLEGDSLKLFKNDVEFSLTPTSDIKLEITLKDKEEVLYFTESNIDVLKDNLKTALKSKLPYRLYLRPFGLHSNIIMRSKDIVDIEVEKENFLPKTIVLKTSWAIQKMEKPREGVADYRNLRKFMPKWSTAYKFPYSTHAKVVEPLFSNIEYLREYIQKNLEGFEPPSNEIHSYRKSKLFSIPSSEAYLSLSEEQHEYLKEDIYLHNLQRVIDFGNQFNSLYIRTPSFSYSFDLFVEGEYNNHFVTEKVTISSSGVYKLRFKYNKIFNIVIDPSSTNISFELETTPLLISNFLSLNSFIFEERKDTTLDIIDRTILQLKNKKTSKLINAFKYLDPDDYEGSYIDKYDHILVYKDNALWSSKLDSKIDFKIPKDISYNNSMFIEQCDNGNGDHFYGLEVFISDFFKHSEQLEASIKVSYSNETEFYLTDDLTLIESDTPIYLDSTRLRNSRSLTLNIELEEHIEWCCVELIDRDGKHKISRLIHRPFIELVKSYDFKNLEKDLQNLDIDGLREDLFFERNIKGITPLLIDNIITLKVEYEGSDLFKYLLIPLENKKDYESDSFYNKLNYKKHEKVDELYEIIP